MCMLPQQNALYVVSKTYAQCTSLHVTLSTAQLLLLQIVAVAGISLLGFGHA